MLSLLCCFNIERKTILSCLNARVCQTSIDEKIAMVSTTNEVLMDVVLDIACRVMYVTGSNASEND